MRTYKLVVNSYELYDSASDACVANTTYEFYQINENVPTPLLDEAGDDLLTNRPKPRGPQQRNYNSLNSALARCWPRSRSAPAISTSTGW